MAPWQGERPGNGHRRRETTPQRPAVTGPNERRKTPRAHSQAPCDVMGEPSAETLKPQGPDGRATGGRQTRKAPFGIYPSVTLFDNLDPTPCCESGEPRIGNRLKS